MILVTFLLPSDNGKTTDDEDSEDDDFTDPTFAPPLFEELIPEEQHFKIIQKCREADDEIKGSIDSAPIVTTKKQRKMKSTGTGRRGMNLWLSINC